MLSSMSTGNKILLKNIFSNYFGSFFAIIIPIISIPFYLKIFGKDIYGIISFILTIQSVLMIIDSGMVQFVIREFSSLTLPKGKKRAELAKTLYSLEYIYWLLGAFFILILFFLSDLISNHWLIIPANLSNLSKISVIGASIIFFVSFPGTLYRSVLLARQKHFLINCIVFLSVILRHPLGLFIYYFYPNLILYICWNIFVSLVDTLLKGYFSWVYLLIKRTLVRIEFNEFLILSKNVSGMSGAIFIGSLTTQVDRIILSRYVPISEFGIYSIAANISQGVIGLITPLIVTFSPQIMALKNRAKLLKKINIKLSLLIAFVSSSAALFFIFFGKFIITMWILDGDFATILFNLLSLLLLGSLFNAFYHVGFFNWIAKKNTRKIATINIISFSGAILLLPFFIKNWGCYGATFSFVLINALGLLVSLDWLFKSN